MLDATPATISQESHDETPETLPRLAHRIRAAHQAACEASVTALRAALDAGDALVPVARLNAAGTWLACTPLRRVWLVTPRPSIPPHSYLLAGKKPQGGRVDFARLVWERGYRGHPQVRWLPRGSDRKRIGEET
jgi:hypothetical protein